jgi:hypothetical protein
MANKDGFRLERICVCGRSRKVARFEIVRETNFRLQQEYICTASMLTALLKDKNECHFVRKVFIV